MVQNIIGNASRRREDQSSIMDRHKSIAMLTLAGQTFGDKIGHGVDVTRAMVKTFSKEIAISGLDGGIGTKMLFAIRLERMR